MAIDWRYVGLYREGTGNALEEKPTTKAQALADRRAALTELRTTGKMTGVHFVAPGDDDVAEPASPYTVDDIDWTAFDLRFDLVLVASPDPTAVLGLIRSYDAPELARDAAKRYMKKCAGALGWRVEVVTASRDEKESG